MNKTNDEIKYCVYMHIFPNQKRYIGQTCQKPERRWNNNGSGYLGKRKNGEYKQPLIANAIQQYGWENIKHEILFNNEDESIHYKRAVVFESEFNNDKFNGMLAGILMTCDWLTIYGKHYGVISNLYKYNP